MAPDAQTHASRLSFGVAHRVWLVVGVILLIVTATHFVLPTTRTDPEPNIYSNADLKPVNYLNLSSIGPNPFAFCPIYGPADQIGAKYGALALSQTRSHLGSGARVQRVLNKALAGHPVTISVLGGSVSACHGAGDDPISPKCYPSRFFQWWNSVFPHPATELTNGAMRRTNSGYFAYCNNHHLPDVTDLVVVELDTEDPPGEEMMENFEILIRSILIRPDQPAVILLGHFSPQIHQGHGFAGPDHWHNAVAQFYDVPHISTKAILLPSYMHEPASVTKYYVDPMLANPLGHELITDVLIAYFQSQTCTAWAVANGAAYDAVPVHVAGGDSPGLFGGMGQRKGVPELGAEDAAKVRGADENDDAAVARAAAAEDEAQAIAAKERAGHQSLRVPPGRINTRPTDGRVFEELAPFCVSANDLINPLPPSLFYGSGWFAYHPEGSGAHALQTAAHYWYSTLPTSKIRIPMQVGAGDIGVYYLREPISQIGEGSAIECWVDDNYAGAKTIENAAADIGSATPALKVIDRFVSRGSHFVECQLLGEEGKATSMFKIIGIFST